VGTCCGGFSQPSPSVGDQSQRELRVLFHIVFHAPNFWLRVVHQKVCSAPISVVRKAHTACVDDERLLSLRMSDGSDKRTMNMPIDDSRLVERPVDRPQLLVACFRAGRVPRTSTVLAFCRERGLCRPYFSTWKKRLQESATAQYIYIVPFQLTELRAQVTSGRARSCVHSIPDLSLLLPELNRGSSVPRYRLGSPLRRRSTFRGA
jgi:hypothetical protein